MVISTRAAFAFQARRWLLLGRKAPTGTRSDWHIRQEPQAGRNVMKPKRRQPSRTRSAYCSRVDGPIRTSIRETRPGRCSQGPGGVMPCSCSRITRKSYAAAPAGPASAGPGDGGSEWLQTGTRSDGGRARRLTAFVEQLDVLTRQHEAHGGPR